MSTHIYLVQLQHQRLNLELVPLVISSKQRVDRPVYDAGVVPFSHYRVRLPATRLPVAKHAHVVPIKRRLHQVLRFLVNLRLRRLRAEHIVVLVVPPLVLHLIRHQGLLLRRHQLHGVLVVHLQHATSCRAERDACNCGGTDPRDDSDVTLELA